jgi:hypothetical protein
MSPSTIPSGLARYEEGVLATPPPVIVCGSNMVTTHNSFGKKEGKTFVGSHFLCALASRKHSFFT